LCTNLRCCAWLMCQWRSPTFHTGFTCPFNFYIYFTGWFLLDVGNLHPKFRSSLKSLNLAILCPVKWINIYGMDKVLRPFMSDLALLESVSHNCVILKFASQSCRWWCYCQWWIQQDFYSGVLHQPSCCCQTSARQ
jgi:hypothetical protein